MTEAGDLTALVPEGELPHWKLRVHELLHLAQLRPVQLG